MSLVHDLPYGAFEQKRCYQKHLLSGTLFSVVLTFVITGTVWLLTEAPSGDGTQPTGENEGIGYRDTLTFDPGSAWRIEPKRPISTGGGSKESTRFNGNVTFGNEPEFNFDTGDPLPGYISGGPEDDPLGAGGYWGDGFPGGDPSGGGGVGGPRDETPIPPSNVFVPFEEPPMLVKEYKPVYPKLALDGGFSARVIVSAFVGDDGLVKKVEIISCNRPNMGFEEEAVRAAYKAIFRPAIQNRYPVGVWISYTILFELTG
ncbi:MAG: energy transducer TonB [Candidatus Zixiibacteriota bacterium]